MKNLYLLCGIPASGKTTWAKKHNTGIYISRDEIRLSLLKDTDEYFSKENEVYNRFVNYIYQYLTCAGENIDIYVDQTSLNVKSRAKLLNRLPLKDVNVIPVNFIISTNTCLKRNRNRTGRACVPDDAIRNMSNSFVPAYEKERKEYTKIINVYEDGEEEINDLSYV